jgi:hypothetical protein
MSILEETIGTLVRLKENDTPSQKTQGICGSVRSGACRKILALAFQNWPKFSGDITYPIRVEHANSQLNAYYNAERENSLWDKDTVYGRNRWELLDFVIEFLKQCDTVVVTNISVHVVNELNDDSIMFGDVFFVVVHYPSLPEELQDLEFLVDCWHRKKDIHSFSKYCTKL